MSVTVHFKDTSTNKITSLEYEMGAVIPKSGDHIVSPFNADRTAVVREVTGVAEHEASMISARTKAALGAAKARGVRLGGQRGSPDRMGGMARKGNAASAIVRRAASAKRNEDLLPVIEDIRAAGFSTPQQIADGLNERGITGRARWLVGSRAGPAYPTPGLVHARVYVSSIPMLLLSPIFWFLTDNRYAP